MISEKYKANTKQQVKSKRRVADHGEVFTSEREVNAMLDLVKEESERIDSKFLEPACGTGNFLVEILRRKLAVVENKYTKRQIDFERQAIIAISSIYGIDILEDNVKESRRRLFNIFDTLYNRLFDKDCKDGCRTSVKYILENNILRGDALTLNLVGQTEEPIVFSEWTFINDRKINRRVFTLASLLEAETAKNNEALNNPLHNNETPYIPMPVKEYEPIHFLKLANHE